MEVRPWIFNLGWGIDKARHYQNFLFSAGVDLAKVARKLDLIPQEPHYSPARMLPNPTTRSKEGLPRTLLGMPPLQSQGPYVIDVGMQIPEKLEKQFRNAPEGLQKLGKDVIDTAVDLPSDVKRESNSLLKRGGVIKK
jgi:hypothetical protein